MIIYIVTLNHNDVVFGSDVAQFYPLDEYKSGDKLVVEITDKFPANFKFYNMNDGKVERKALSYIYRHIKPLFEDMERLNIDMGISAASFYKTFKKSTLKEIPKEGLEIYRYKNLTIRAYDI